jgi:hypothetical protein
VESKEGQGTTFYFMLPTTEQPVVSIPHVTRAVAQT